MNKAYWLCLVLLKTSMHNTCYHACYIDGEVRPSEKRVHRSQSWGWSLSVLSFKHDCCPWHSGWPLGFQVISAHTIQLVCSLLQPLIGCLAPTIIVTGTGRFRGANRGVWSLISGGDKNLRVLMCAGRIPRSCVENAGSIEGRPGFRAVARGDVR